MFECRECKSNAVTMKQVRGGPNQGRDYTACAKCGKFSAFADGLPSAKPKQMDGAMDYRPDAAASGSRHIPDSEAQPTFTLHGAAEELRTAAKRLRDEDASWKSEEPAAKRQRPEESVAPTLTTALLDIIAGVGSIVKRFDAAATKLEKIGVLFSKKDAPEDKIEQDSQSN